MKISNEKLSCQENFARFWFIQLLLYTAEVKQYQNSFM